jgi:hypothetical protein
VNFDDLISLDQAAEIAGRAPVTMRRAADIGKLDAKLIGTGPRAVWVTTHDAVSAYLAYVASAAWANRPQRVKAPGGHPRVKRPTRRRRRKG